MVMQRCRRWKRLWLNISRRTRPRLGSLAPSSHRNRVESHLASSGNLTWLQVRRRPRFTQWRCFRPTRRSYWRSSTREKASHQRLWRNCGGLRTWRYVPPSTPLEQSAVRWRGWWRLSATCGSTSPTYKKRTNLFLWMPRSPRMDCLEIQSPRWWRNSGQFPGTGHSSPRMAQNQFVCLCLPVCIPLRQDMLLQARGMIWNPLARFLEIMGVASERNELICPGLSVEATETIINSRAVFTRRLYAFKWQRFTTWCRSCDMDPAYCPLFQYWSFFKVVFQRE